MFGIFNAETHKPMLIGELKEPVTFTCREAAQSYADDMTFDGGSRWYVKAVPNPEWRDRECLRFHNRTYTKPVWASHDFWSERPQELVEHYTHVSLKNPDLIAFTTSPEKGELDIQTPMKPGAYLKKFFSDVLSATEIKSLAELHKQGRSPTKGHTLQFAKSENDIIDVYASGPSSCMHGEDCVRVYAAGDLAIAYTGDKNEAVHARALVWPERKVYGRVYPNADKCDDSERNALITLLQAAGYREGVGCAFGGARLLKIRHDYHDDCYVMPYLDWDYGVSDSGEYWRMSRSGADYACQETNGRISIESEPEYTCYRCEDGCDEIQTVYIGENRARDWCEHCCNNHAFHCNRTNEYVADDYGVEINGEFVAEWVDFNHCDFDNAYTFDDVNEVRTGLDKYATENWRVSNCEEHAFRAAHDNLWYAKCLASPETLNQDDDGIWRGAFIGVDTGQHAYVSTDPAQLPLFRHEAA